MKNRELGASGISTAPLVFGGNVFGWTVKGKDTGLLLDAFVDAGFNTIDTADVYSRWVEGNKGGESETEGSTIKMRRLLGVTDVEFNVIGSFERQKIFLYR